MTKKTTEAYVALFEFISSKVFPLNPKTFMMDFEQAPRKAILDLYPNCEVSGCLFHYKQAIRKRAKRISGFFDALNGDLKANKLYHKFLVLPHLPADKIIEAFTIIKTECQQFGELFTEFLKYFESQWVVIVSYFYVVFI